MSSPLTVPPAVGRRRQHVDATTFRAAFRRHAASVVVITADAGDGPVGFTATSLTSVSLSPPLVSFAIAGTASSWPVIFSAPAVVVHFLGADQYSIAARFATSGVDRFAPPTRWSRLPTGEPVLEGVPSHLRCRVRDRLPVGDHHLIVAEATAATVGEPHAPLIYHSGSYTTAADR